MSEGGGAWRSTAEQKMMAHCLTSHFVFHLSWITELRIWFGVGIFFSPSAVECSSFQVLVSQEIITHPLQIVRTTELLLCWMAVMLGSSRRWILSVYIYISLLLVYIFLVHPDRMRKWGLISFDGRWIDFLSLWSRSMSPAITISDRFRSVVSLREFWAAASNPSSRAFNPLPPSLLIQPLSYTPRPWSTARSSLPYWKLLGQTSPSFQL
jgi:hypothetical protein